MKKILITDDVHHTLIEGLEADGFICDYFPKISLEEVHNIIQPYTGIIINSKILVDRVLIDKASKLKFIGRLGSGLEIVDRGYCREKGIEVHAAPEGNRNAVAEHALGMLLALANNLNRADAEVRQKIWKRENNRGFEIMGKTFGIIGFGHTGSTFAKKLSGMDVQILAYDKYKKNYATDLSYVEETTLQHIFKEGNIISLHLPLTTETNHLVNEEFIQKCQQNFILINTSRGQVVKTRALINSLTIGKITGACLDVFENEKPTTFTSEEEHMYEQLYQFPQVILSPHVAGWTKESKKRLASVLLGKIRAASVMQPDV